MATILVIDDDEMMRQMMQRMLQHEGYSVLEADNGDEGVRLFGDHTVDLVITDLFMPPKGGVEVIKELRATDAEIKIIAMTGVEISGPGFREDLDPSHLATEAGAACALRKPFSQEELVGAVEKILKE